MDLSQLNENQKQAVTTTKGPLLILAGAGSGKTRVLTTKIAYLIQEKNISPYNILAITFTNKAANEMLTRVNNMVGSVANNMQISTFHSFGLKIVRENIKSLGYDSNFTILDADDSLSVVKRVLKNMNLDVKIYNPKAFKQKISSLKNEMVSPLEYNNYVASEYDKVFVKAYSKYEETLRSNNAFDFDDLLLKPLELFKKEPTILEKYQERFQYILVDEYQDTNEPQYLFTKYLAKNHQNICVVGDIDQSIFSWRGANYRNILNFEKDYENPKMIVLDINYRSTQNILDAANNVIINNVNRKEKNLKSIKEQGPLIKYFKAFNEKDEAFYVARKIKELKQKGHKYNEMTIIYRTNAQSRVVEEVLIKEKIAYKIIGGVNFYLRKEIKDVLAYLKLIHNPSDETSLLRIINTPRRGIGLKSIENISNKATKERTTMFDAIDSGKELIFKETIIDLINKSKKMTLTELLDELLDKSGIRQSYIMEKTLEADIRLENLNEFKSITKSFEDRYGIVSLEDFLHEVSLVSEVDHTGEADQVNLMTIHAVKGLEFDNVFIIGLEEGLFPHQNSMFDNNELEEERRLAYVAITRARENLFLVNTRQRMFFGKFQNNLTSRFINEIDESLLDKEFKDEEKVVKHVETDFYSEEDVEYQVGDFVYHDVFGNGKVTEISGSLISVAFKLPYGVKKIIKNHKSLRRIKDE